MKSLRILAVLIACCLSVAVVGQSSPVLKFREGSVWITGLSTTESASFSQEQWTTLLRVYTHDAFAKKIDQSIAGTFTARGDSLLFTPNFSFTTGQQYHAVFDYEAFHMMSGKPTGQPHTFELAFAIPRETFIVTSVATVHPQVDVLPENILRLHITFSNAMMPGEAYEHIALLQEDGMVIEKAFLVIDQELWDAERKRFTLLFDPGRIKRGIQSQTDLGAPLQTGHTYRLVIDSLWRDANGNSLTSSYSKAFTVTAAQRSRLNIKLWKITAPVAGTRKELMMEFDRPMDYILTLKYITITSAEGELIHGQATFTKDCFWRFTPDHPWKEGKYIICVDPKLEDVTGNNFNNAFDIDLTKEDRKTSTEIIRHSFIVRPLLP